MTQAERCDAIVIGAGQAGTPLAMALSKAGWTTALVERAHVGGTCINEGCTPTKTMIASARVAYLARRAADYGVQNGPITVDMSRVRQRKRDIVESFRSGSQRRIEATAGLDLLLGETRFTGPKVIRVAMREGRVRHLTADTVLINVGTRARVPMLPRSDQVPLLDSTSIMELDEVPEHLLVLGGGYIGLEFGQMFRRFGSQVTIVQRRAQLLPREDRDVADGVATILREDGIEIWLDTEPVQVAPSDDGKIALMVRTPEDERTIVGSRALLAVGQTSNSDGLNLRAAGRLVPYTVFIDPQLGRVGLTEQEARAQGRSYRVGKIPLTWVVRALEVGEARSFMKAIVDAETDQMLGAAILGLEGSEVMAVLQMAMMDAVPYATIRDGVFAHPTLSESLNNLFMALDSQRARQNPGGKLNRGGWRMAAGQHSGSPPPVWVRARFSPRPQPIPGAALLRVKTIHRRGSGKHLSRLHIDICHQCGWCAPSMERRPEMLRPIGRIFSTRATGVGRWTNECL